MAKKVTPGPGNPEGPKVEEKPAEAPKMEEKPAADPPKPEDLQDFAINSMEVRAFTAADENRQRAAMEAQRAATQVADIVEEIVDRINEEKKTKFKTEDVRGFNVKKRFISIALKKETKKE